MSRYRGRLAPSPTGYLHLGHAQTFATAAARAQQGDLILRVEDLDRARCKPEFYDALFEDLRWFGLRWNEGPEAGGPHAPYLQSARDYFWAWEKLRAGGFIYPCTCSRRDVRAALGAPHEPRGLDEETFYPGTCRPPRGWIAPATSPAGKNWRFRVPEGATLSFCDGRLGPQTAVAGAVFGDFVIWRKDNLPAYQLAVVADDAAMKITEVVRGEDLLVSTFRQLLLYRALDFVPPAFFHGPLVADASGQRLAKRHDALSLRSLRERGERPETLRASLAAR